MSWSTTRCARRCVSEPADDGGGEVLRYRKGRHTEPAEPQKNILPAAIKPTSAAALADI